MSILQSLILAFAIATGSFISDGTTASTQGGSDSTYGPIKCEAPCRIDDPKCRCAEDPK
jgi:hypothetical protein